MKNFDICQLDQFQIATASEIAAKAFADDPVFNYLTPNTVRLSLRPCCE
jgi:hypothetical protein